MSSNSVEDFSSKLLGDVEHLLEICAGTCTDLTAMDTGREVEGEIAAKTMLLRENDDHMSLRDLRRLATAFLRIREVNMPPIPLGLLLALYDIFTVLRRNVAHLASQEISEIAIDCSELHQFEALEDLAIIYANAKLTGRKLLWGEDGEGEVEEIVKDYFTADLDDDLDDDDYEDDDQDDQDYDDQEEDEDDDDEEDDDEDDDDYHENDDEADDNDAEHEGGVRATYNASLDKLVTNQVNSLWCLDAGDWLLEDSMASKILDIGAKSMALLPNVHAETIRDAVSGLLLSLKEPKEILGISVKAQNTLSPLYQQAINDITKSTLRTIKQRKLVYNGAAKLAEQAVVTRIEKFEADRERLEQQLEEQKLEHQRVVTKLENAVVRFETIMSAHEKAEREFDHFISYGGLAETSALLKYQAHLVKAEFERKKFLDGLANRTQTLGCLHEDQLLSNDHGVPDVAPAKVEEEHSNDITEAPSGINSANSNNDHNGGHDSGSEDESWTNLIPTPSSVGT